MRYLTICAVILSALVLESCAASNNYSRMVALQDTPQFLSNRELVVQVMLTTPVGGNLSVGLGTGVVVDVNGLVLTNYHNVKSENSVGVDANDSPAPQPSAPRNFVCTVNLGERDCKRAVLVAEDKEHDLALLKVDKKFPRAVEFASDRELMPSTDVYYWGNILSFAALVPITGHYITHIEPPYFNGQRFSTALPLLLLDMNVSPGASGSPLFNRGGLCVGLVNSFTSPMLGGRSLGTAIPAAAILEFIKKNMS